MEQEDKQKQGSTLAERMALAVGTTVLAGIVKALVDALLRRGC